MRPKSPSVTTKSGIPRLGQVRGDVAVPAPLSRIMILSIWIRILE